MSDSAAMTVAIPCFNAAGFLEMALDSVSGQTLQPAETIVIDDGSTDNSVAVIHGFPNVKIISHHHNRGIAAARNTAWRHAVGDIVVFIDADTVAHPRLLEVLADCYRAENVAGVGGRAIEINQKTPYDLWRKTVLFQSWGKRYLSDAPFLFGLCSSFRKSILAKFHGFDPSFTVSGEDMDLSFRIRRAGFRLAYHPQAVVFHLRNDDRSSIKKMTYRHCLGGFIAQRKNQCYKNKISLARSAALFFEQVFLNGIARGNLGSARLTLLLYATILMAWLDSRRRQNGRAANPVTRYRQPLWEGHGDVSGRSDSLNPRETSTRRYG